MPDASPLTQRESGSISAMKADVLDCNDKYVLVLITGKSRRPEPKPFVILERHEHYLGIIASFEDDSSAQSAYYGKYSPYCDYEDSQK